MSFNPGDRESKTRFISDTMTGFYSLMRNLQEDYRTYSRNYSEEALELLSRSYGFTESVNAIKTLGSLDRIDDDGIDELFDLSQQIVGLYHLRSENCMNLVKTISISNDAWRIYLNKENKISKIEYGSDKTKAQVIQSDGTVDSVIEMAGPEYNKIGFAKKLLTAAGLEATDKADLELQEKMLDGGLFYIEEEWAKKINIEKGWIKREDYYTLMTPKDFLNLKNYKDVTVKCVYEDDNKTKIGTLTFTYSIDNTTKKLFTINASNRQRERPWPTVDGKLNSKPMYTMPNTKGKQIVPYKPGEFPKGKWKIIAFEKDGTEEFGEYKIRTNAIRNVIGYREKKDENNILIGWDELKNDKNENELFEDGHLLIHGGTGKIIECLSEIEKLDARKGTNDYIGTTQGCIRIKNCDVCLIVHVLSNYLDINKEIELEVK